jgi:hypothetical protein
LHIESDRAMKRKSYCACFEQVALALSYPRGLPHNRRASVMAVVHIPVFRREGSDAGSELGESVCPRALSVNSPVLVSLRYSEGLMSQSTRGRQSTRLRDQGRGWEDPSDSQTASPD